MAEELSLAQISAGVITEINTNFSQTEDAVNAKAELNGDSTQKFNVADAVELTEAINKKQLNNAVCSIETDISELEATVETKADLNGSTTQVFNVADATTSTQAVNKGQLDSAIAEVKTKTIYDSGWFSVGLNAEYIKNHNLDTTNVILTTLVRSAEGQKEMINPHLTYDPGNGTGQSYGSMTVITQNNAYLRTGTVSLTSLLDAYTGYPYSFSSGEARIIIEKRT